jgi:hypothetical protein
MAQAPVEAASHPPRLFGISPNPGHWAISSRATYPYLSSNDQDVEAQWTMHAYLDLLLYIPGSRRTRDKVRRSWLAIILVGLP